MMTKDENQADDVVEIQPPPPKKGRFGDGVVSNVGDSTSSGESNHDHDGEKDEDDSAYQGDDEGNEEDSEAKYYLEDIIPIHKLGALDFGGKEVGKLERKLVHNFDSFAYAMNRAWAKHMGQPRSEVIDTANLWPGFNIEYVSLIESNRDDKVLKINTLHLEEMEWVNFIDSLVYVNVQERE